MTLLVITVLASATLGAYVHARLAVVRAAEDAESRRRVLAELQRIELHDPERIVEG